MSEKGWKKRFGLRKIADVVVRKLLTDKENKND